jgi:hypothetical protein
MRAVVTATAIVSVLATSAAADDLARLEGRQHGRAFWLNNQPWPNPRDQSPGQAKPPFTMTYTDGVAQRLHLGSSRDFFAQKLGGVGAPALVGTVDHGAGMLELRWRTGE